MKRLISPEEWIGVSFILALLTFFLLLAGCSAINTSPNTQISSGIAHVWETAPKYNAVIMVHCEDRPEESAISRFIGVFENISGWPQAVASVVTGPNRVADAAVGGDRWELMIAVGGPKPDAVEAVVTQAMEKADLTHDEQCAIGKTNT